MHANIHDGFLPAYKWEDVLRMVKTFPWSYGSKSNGETDPHGHWSYKPFHDDRANLSNLLPIKGVPAFDIVWQAISSSEVVRAHQAVPIRVYANGYTYGTDGYFHTDSSRSDEMTYMLYAVPKWDRDWAGETVFSHGNFHQSVLPWPNRLVKFPSTLAHAGRAVSRKCNVMRTVLVFKARARRTDEFEQLSQFLLRAGARHIKHQKGSLHDHLVRVFQLLKDRGCPLEVCYGGGLHSIYGTNSFQQQLFAPTPDQRSRIATVFGKEAEMLAWLFGAIDRPKCLQTAVSADAHMFLDMRHAQKVPVTSKVFEQLCLIEAANLADQDSLDKWPYLQKRWESP
ncbi:MAG TPA: 2OG-Fe(II) oxygenase [Candidatus Angelobacter sp.]|nr:2OG-Fe(II) oxygenase [Candidatus Angelobacter sp.]